MARHIAIEAQSTEPAIGKVQVDLLAQLPLRPDAEAVTHNQHSDQQFRRDRGTTGRAIECHQMRSHAFEINKPVDRPKHVLGWNVPLQRKLVEKSRLIDLPFAYHALHPRPRCLSESTLRTVHKPEFFNTIDPERTSQSQSRPVVLARGPDLSRRVAALRRC